jgi:hypothetical protein
MLLLYFLPRRICREAAGVTQMIGGAVERGYSCHRVPIRTIPAGGEWLASQ